SFSRFRQDQVRRGEEPDHSWVELGLGIFSWSRPTLDLAYRFRVSLGNPNGELLNLFNQNETIGTYQTRSLTCIPRKNQPHRAASERSTMTVRRLSLFLILRNLIIISPSTRCSSSCAMMW